MPVVVNLYCGLANRMFQYCCYLYLRGQGYDARVHYEKKYELAHEKVDWEKIFPKAGFVESSRFVDELYGGSLSKLSRFRRRFLPWTCAVYKFKSPFEVPDLSGGSGDICCSGFYQNAAMVESLGEIPFRLFEFPEIKDERNLNFLEEIQTCNSVAVHIRKGSDYLNRKEFSSTCGPEYYRKAIAYMSERVENPKFFVFTDNPDRVGENLAGIDYTLVAGNPSSGPGSHLDMQLMSLCRHNITANSSYSWWGAYLNVNPEKIVIIPELWIRLRGGEKPHSSAPSLKCKGWIGI